jgi:hypothetical protein
MVDTTGNYSFQCQNIAKVKDISNTMGWVPLNPLELPVDGAV